MERGAFRRRARRPAAPRRTAARPAGASPCEHLPVQPGVTFDHSADAEVALDAVASGGGNLRGQGRVVQQAIGIFRKPRPVAHRHKVAGRAGRNQLPVPGMSVATTGTPAAIASMITFD